MPNDFFQVGGTLSENAPSYIERPADRALLTALEKGDLCLVLAPRQTGKSSLMVHTRRRLKVHGVQAGIVDFQALGNQQDADQWFGDVLYQVERSLPLETDSTAWWEAHQRLGPTQRFSKYLEDVVLAACSGQVVLFFDEIDSVLGLPFSDDFFTTLRALYNARSTNPTLQRLTFALFGVTTASSFIQDRSRTPFNIGKEIALTDFDRTATEPFTKVLGPESDALVDRIFYWTNGQPLLVQKLAAEAAAWPEEERTAERIDEAVQHDYLDRKIEQDTHLKFIQDYLLDTTIPVRKTLKTYQQVLTGQQVPVDEKSPIQNRLRLAGIVRAENKRLAPRNRIYARIFDRKWVQEHTPRYTYKLVVYSTSSVMILLIIALGYAVVQQKQNEALRRTVTDMFYEKKQQDLTIAQLLLELDESENDSLRERLAQIQTARDESARRYDGLVEELGIYRRLTEEEQHIYDIARIFNESQVDMPASFVAEVKRYIRETWLTHRGRSTFQTSIRRAQDNNYIEFIVRTFQDHGLPPQFIYLALQESNFDIEATGWFVHPMFGRAKGMWQFIPETARRYGLFVPELNQNAAVVVPEDERHDFEKSTVAIAEYFQEIYVTMTQASGLLAMASYNWGEHRVFRQLNQLSGLENIDVADTPETLRARTYWNFLTQFEEQMPDQTKEYVLKIFAAAVIGEDPRRYGFDFDNPLKPYLEASQGKAE